MNINRIWNRKWNTEREIVFQTVILQLIRLVSGAKNICDRITSRLELWNKGAYNELVQDPYGTAKAYLGKTRGTQTQEQHHRNF